MISYLFSYQPKSNNKADNNSPSEPTASKYVTPVGKLYVTYSPLLMLTSNQQVVNKKNTNVSLLIKK